ncbi:MAG: hypothetical protein J3R72DRAFT_457248 [Linnemannia gamsii]|nr:MAG: hypothetical protein J3R72DRAFT_457248 [Linnemannia gamsii]
MICCWVMTFFFALFMLLSALGTPHITQTLHMGVLAFVVIIDLVRVYMRELPPLLSYNPTHSQNK